METTYDMSISRFQLISITLEKHVKIENNL
jgi:hypothetical protein